MKQSNNNNFGRKYLVEECKNIRIDDLVRKAKVEVLESLVRGLIEVEGYQVGLTNHVLHHGGKRLWFECPICKCKCGIIYKHPTKNSLVGCRLCLDLEYRCRRFKGMLENLV